MINVSVEQGGSSRSRESELEAALVALVSVLLPGQLTCDLLADADRARQAVEAAAAQQRDEDAIESLLAQFSNSLQPLAYITKRGAIYGGASNAGNRQLCGLDDAVQACGVALRTWQRGAVPLQDEMATFTAWETAAPVLSPFAAWKARAALSAPWRWSLAMDMLAKIRRYGYLSDSMAAKIDTLFHESRYKPLDDERGTAS